MRTIIEHAWVLTMDPQNTCYKDGYVIIEGSKILKTGEGPSPLEGNRRIDAKGAILMPGMVNVHTHVPMIPFRTMGDDCQDRLRRFLFPLEEMAVTPALVYWGSLYGMAEMLLSGITTFLDMYYFEDQAAEACDKAGMRGILGGDGHRPENLRQRCALRRPGLRGGLYSKMGRPSPHYPHGLPPRHQHQLAGISAENLCHV